ncbi:hypothetical protein BDV95DRAFT_270310 [Massariosphaeria phaeospora]|uniref:Uncharacterized protein n=1 Tax=Massariosphaeria phaeospora TaxID=100035 RepID=A0A7C8M3Q9_9PLEO|nr:hypothetical protein BDV95DRAFT_270310 [Massariosphaeria phaeospora]
MHRVWGWRACFAGGRLRPAPPNKVPPQLPGPKLLSVDPSEHPHLAPIRSGHVRQRRVARTGCLRIRPAPFFAACHVHVDDRARRPWHNDSAAAPSPHDAVHPQFPKALPNRGSTFRLPQHLVGFSPRSPPPPCACAMTRASPCLRAAVPMPPHQC